MVGSKIVGRRVCFQHEIMRHSNLVQCPKFTLARRHCKGQKGGVIGQPPKQTHRPNSLTLSQSVRTRVLFLTEYKVDWACQW